MIMKKLNFSFLLGIGITTISINFVFATGMYIPIASKLPAKELQAAGIKLSSEQIETMAKGAIAQLGGCSSSFLSKDGLLGTNWHCALSCASQIQAKSQKEQGLSHPHSHIVQTGYIASTMEEELLCSNMNARIIKDIQNVSDKLLPILQSNDLSAKEKTESLRQKTEDIRESCMKKDIFTICEVVFMNNDPQPYYLFTYQKMTDIRLAWIPPEAVGMFGGSLDNWEYPRHSVDFSFVRVYKDNKPYQPKSYVQVSTQGIHPGEPQFILGFPGQTERNISSFAAEFMQLYDLPLRYKVYHELTQTISKVFPNPQTSPYASAWFYLENYVENYQRKSQQMNDQKIVEKKHQEEMKIKEAQAGLPSLKRIYSDMKQWYSTPYLIDFMTGRRSPAKSVVAASYIWNWANQPTKDRDRKDERFKSWNKDQVLRDILMADDQTSLKGEKRLLVKLFQLADSFSVPVRAFERLKNQSKKSSQYRNLSIYEQMVQELYDHTQLVAKSDSKAERSRASAVREKLFNSNPKDLIQTNDALILFVKNLLVQKDELLNDWEYGASASYELQNLAYQFNLAMNPTTPDANGTIRLTFGTVQARYNPIYKKGSFSYATTLTEMMKKDHQVKKDHPDYVYFLIPDEMKKAYSSLTAYKEKAFFDRTLNDIPVAFITDHVITGGNSGSGVFDSRGKLVGFAFDGTPESIVTDVYFHPQSRTIAVDIRIVGFLGNEVYPKAKRLVAEIGFPVY